MQNDHWDICNKCYIIFFDQNICILNTLNIVDCHIQTIILLYGISWEHLLNPIWVPEALNRLQKSRNIVWNGKFSCVVSIMYERGLTRGVVLPLYISILMKASHSLWNLSRPTGPIFGPEGPHRWSQRLHPSSGARKGPRKRLLF